MFCINFFITSIFTDLRKSLKCSKSSKVDWLFLFLVSINQLADFCWIELWSAISWNIFRIYLINYLPCDRDSTNVYIATLFQNSRINNTMFVFFNQVSKDHWIGCLMKCLGKKESLLLNINIRREFHHFFSVELLQK